MSRKKKEEIDETLLQVHPVLPLRDIVVFPHMIVPLFVGRDSSVAALEDAMSAPNKTILLLTQKNSTDDNPSPDDLYDVGTLGHILQLLRLPDGTVKVLVEGLMRMQVLRIKEEGNILVSHSMELKNQYDQRFEVSQALSRTLADEFSAYLQHNDKIPFDVSSSIYKIEDPGTRADTVASYFNLKVSEKQAILNSASVEERINTMLAHIEGEMSMMKLEKRIRSRVKQQMEKTQRDYYLNEQLKAIHKELGSSEDGHDEFSLIEKRVNAVKLPKEALEKVQAELRKLRLMPSSSAEATVVRNYIDWMLDVPWNKPKKVRVNLKEAEDILDRDHYGLDKVKERILDYLAVQARVKKVSGQILCLVGPPGVGKTSLGRSIAEATGRAFVRVSLGGMRDESEIRGHRRTYIGSMPGRIIQGMKKAKSSNPLFVLDEIDKLGQDWRGDPASALLEVLDPEQNNAFNDHYLEVDYDLSDVMFVTTANSLNLPRPLLDRLEIIRVPGYTDLEKMSIARQHLLPKEMKLHKLTSKDLEMSDAAIMSLIHSYTREAGVRNLEREIANVCRKVVRQLSGHNETIRITPENLKKYAGIPRFIDDHIESESLIGVSAGLAWSEVGGSVMLIEVAVVPGKGKTLITGKLGDVMQESAQAALSYVRMHAAEFGIVNDVFDNRDVHIHVPEGATPKDGPSAGIALCTALVSAFTSTPVCRSVAMTGEITLRGRVLPIGGLKEKMLAAHRHNIKTIIIPVDNEKDLEEIPQDVRDGFQIVLASTVDEVLKTALTKFPTASTAV